MLYILKFATMPNTWRDKARPIIAKVLAENQGADEKVIRKALIEAYPFGERKYHPYKIWCSEVNNQMKGKKKRQIKVEVPKEQGRLF